MARNSFLSCAPVFLEKKIPAYVEHGNFASRKFARSPPCKRACYKLCLCISERRNRTHACYARRAAPTDNQNTPKAMNDFRGILVTRSKPILNRKPPFDASIIPYFRHITKRADLSDRFLCRADRLYEFSAILFPL